MLHELNLEYLIMKSKILFSYLLIVVAFSSTVYSGGTITGVVKFVGENPGYPDAKINKDPEVCGTDSRPSEKLILSADNNIKNVFVNVKGVIGEKLSAPATNPVFPQAKCQFTEHVMVVPTGSTVDFPNKEDKVMHNLHSYSMKNRPFNKGVPFGGVISNTFAKPETVKVTCDVHKWMTAYLIVNDDPYYAVSDENGNFKIENVPAGTYKIQAWQESLGKRKADVTVTEGGETTVNFEFTPKKKRKRS